MIKCANGENMVLTHDITLPRALIPGAAACRAQTAFGSEDGNHLFLDGMNVRIATEWADMAMDYIDSYDHPLWRSWKERKGPSEDAHGGMDTLVLRAISFAKRKKPSGASDLLCPMIQFACLWFPACPNSPLPMRSMPVPILFLILLTANGYRESLRPSRLMHWTPSMTICVYFRC